MTPSIFITYKVAGYFSWSVSSDVQFSHLDVIKFRKFNASFWLWAIFHWFLKKLMYYKGLRKHFSIKTRSKYCKTMFSLGALNFAMNSKKTEVILHATLDVCESSVFTHMSVNHDSLTLPFAVEDTVISCVVPWNLLRSLV